MNNGLVISLGSVNVDFQIRAERCPASGEALIGRDFLLAAGGKAANVAYFARRVGADVLLIGRVGNDALRDVALRPLREAGVILHQVGQSDAVATGMAMIVVYADGNKGIVIAANANDAWDDDAVQGAVQAVAEAPEGSVLVADLEVAPVVVRRCAEAARKRGFPIILDPSPADRVTGDLYSLVDYLTPNTAEAQSLTGIPSDDPESAFRAADAIVARGVRTALVKLGSGGCVVVTAGQRLHIPTFPVNAVDTTGAGDAFAGALGVALIEGRSLAQAARFAVAAAALSVSRFGAQASYPSRQELEGLVG